ncbi:MAG: hypothetical protein HOQ36_03460 [Nocardia sp.]|nr:hypothetical protein [Nocardia sp.]
MAQSRSSRFHPADRLGAHPQRIGAQRGGPAEQPLCGATTPVAGTITIITSIS